MAKINRNWDKMTPDELRAFFKNVIEKCTGNPDIPQDSPEFLRFKAAVAAFESTDDQYKTAQAKLRELKAEARKAHARVDVQARAVYKTQRPKK